jgi:hypothetical protein
MSETGQNVTTCIDADRVSMHKLDLQVENIANVQGCVFRMRPSGA